MTDSVIAALDAMPAPMDSTGRWPLQVSHRHLTDAEKAEAVKLLTPRLEAILMAECEEAPPARPLRTVPGGQVKGPT